ncbi:calcineurin-like phosphoesterase C-terminal domain-containing protein [Chitinophaga sp. 22620]|uniref:calcineurin-like phosphoesterase C-terminal domain-containing protein n=1 Tax=Chitinophaga sp. 22620 TaxID=3453952 RepID=UPI003F83F878
MKRTSIICGLLLCSYAGLQAQTTVRGIVYADVNKNGKHDRAEKGIPKVSVTNGIDVTQTDENGAYELPGGNDQIIAVIKPSGYQVPVNQSNLPQYYVINKPAGSPALKHPGVAPTGKLPASVDFPLTPVNEPRQFKMLCVADPQVTNEKEVDYYHRGLIAELKGVKDVAFGISLGDLVFNHPEIFSSYIRVTSEVGIPWYNVMGNHDMNFDATADSLADESFEAHFGPANYAFNYGKVHFIVLDDVLYPDPRDSQSYWGGFRKSQLDFVENDLKFVPKDYLVVTAFHIPLYEPRTGGDAIRNEDRERLFSLLAPFANTLTISGHTHIQKQCFHTAEDGWHGPKPYYEFNAGTASGNWYSGMLDENGIPASTMSDGTPKGYSFITFTGNQYKINYKAAGMPAAHQIEISAPKVVQVNEANSAGIWANFFMGSEKDSVYFRVDNDNWKPMTFVADKAPEYLHILDEFDYADSLLSGRRPGPASISQHLWFAPIPVKKKAGTHVIEIKATDMFGQTFHQRRQYVAIDGQ